MRSTILLRTAVAVSGLAAAVSLSACDGVTINFGEDGGQAPASEAPRDPEGGTGETTAPDQGTGGDAGTDTGTGTGDDAGTGTDTGTGDSAGTDTGDTGTGAGTGAGTGTGGDGTSEQSADFTIDHNGNGTIPQATLEGDIADAYEEQGTPVSAVECSGDMSIFRNTGSQSCTVTSGGVEHYGVVKVTSVEGQNVYYELEF